MFVIMFRSEEFHPPSFVIARVLDTAPHRTARARSRSADDGQPSWNVEQTGTSSPENAITDHTLLALASRAAGRDSPKKRVPIGKDSVRTRNAGRHHGFKVMMRVSIRGFPCIELKLCRK